MVVLRRQMSWKGEHVCLFHGELQDVNTLGGAGGRLCL